MKGLNAMQTKKPLRGIVFGVLPLLFIFIFACATEDTVHKKGFQAKPCLDCHKNTMSEFQKKYVHDPMKKRDCEACHLRHGKIAVPDPQGERREKTLFPVS